MNIDPDAAEATNTSDVQRIVVPLIEESLKVEKVAVERGGVRLTKRVVVHEQAVDEWLNDEQVKVERRVIGRQVDEAPAARFEGDVYVVPVIEEVLITVKQLVLVEEIHITRTRVARRHQETVALRREEVAIERIDGPVTPVVDPFVPRPE